MPDIHRVTAIAGDPLKNLSFYTRDLGLLLADSKVQRTVDLLVLLR